MIFQESENIELKWRTCQRCHLKRCDDGNFRMPECETGKYFLLSGTDRSLWNRDIKDYGGLCRQRSNTED